MHCTQRGVSPLCASQSGVGAAQSVFVRQATQRPRALQSFVFGVAAHSVFDRHWTQVDVDALHFDAVAGHCASLVQPARHRNASGSQMGEAVPQSAFERHATH